MITCQKCGARSQVNLCNQHAADLRDMLDGLPRWIGFLEETAYGLTRGGGNERRAKSDEQPMQMNPRASNLLDDVRNTLSTWVRELCETRGIDTPALKSAGCAAWLSQNVGAIACDPAAGECYADMARLVDVIERAINPPIPPRFAGPCPTMVEDPRSHLERECGNRLMAPPDATTVRCRACKQEHDIERLINRLLANVDHWRFTREELIGSRAGDWAGVMGLLEEPVSKTTFYRWAKEGALKVSGYRRPDGRQGVARHSEDDEPTYQLGRVRRLRIEMASKQAATRWSAVG